MPELLAFVHVPAPPDHVPAVAPPPIEPPIAAEVSPEQIPVNPDPASTVPSVQLNTSVNVILYHLFPSLYLPLL